MGEGLPNERLVQRECGTIRSTRQGQRRTWNGHVSLLILIQGNQKVLKRINIFVTDCYIYQYCTYTIIIFVVVSIRDENVSHPFERRQKRGDLILLYKPYPVTYHWKDVLYRKIMTPTKYVYDIPGQNGGLSKLTRCQQAAISVRADKHTCKLYRCFPFTCPSKRA